MSDSLGQSYKASDFGKKTSKKKGKHKQESDTPEARESRIRLYKLRANVDPDSERHVRRVGPNGRPIDLFTGEEATEEDMIVVDIEDDEEDE